jgi:hypothetical protein
MTLSTVDLVCISTLAFVIRTKTPFFGKTSFLQSWKQILVWLPRKASYWNMTCFWYSKNDVFVWKLKASVNLTTRSTVKNSHIEHDLVFIFKNSRINDTHSQGYYCQAKNHCSLYNFSRAGLSVSLNMQSVRLFQYKYSASRDIPVPTIQSVGIFQYTILRQ